MNLPIRGDERIDEAELSELRESLAQMKRGEVRDWRELHASLQSTSSDE
jgi:hypothetical protein